MDFRKLRGYRINLDSNLLDTPGLKPTQLRVPQQCGSRALDPNDPLTDIPNDVSKEIFELLPAILFEPKVVLENEDYYLLRPRAFQSSALYLGDIDPCPLGALLESWLGNTQFHISTVCEGDEWRDTYHLAVVDENAAEHPDPRPIEHLYLYRVVGSPLSGNHSARAVTKDGKRHVTLGPYHKKAPLPETFHYWYNSFKTLSESVPLRLNDEVEVVKRLRRDLGL